MAEGRAPQARGLEHELMESKQGVVGQEEVGCGEETPLKGC